MRISNPSTHLLKGIGTKMVKDFAISATILTLKKEMNVVYAKRAMKVNSLCVTNVAAGIVLHVLVSPNPNFKKYLIRITSATSVEARNELHVTQ